MLSGLNHTISYKGLKLHIQTEDCGLENPNIVSHIFLKGQIVASKRLNYSYLLDKKTSNLKKQIRTLMQDQHRNMLRALTQGLYDDGLPLHNS